LGGRFRKNRIFGKDWAMPQYIVYVPFMAYAVYDVEAKNEREAKKKVEFGEDDVDDIWGTKEDKRYCRYAVEKTGERVA
jgi:hypothetical protein